MHTDDVNVIYVDWTEGAIRLYNRAVANARVVGLEIAHLVTWLGRNAGLRAKDVHLIGHSLGAHVCGESLKWMWCIAKAHRLTPLSCLLP